MQSASAGSAAEGPHRPIRHTAIHERAPVRRRCLAARRRDRPARRGRTPCAGAPAAAGRPAAAVQRPGRRMGAQRCCTWAAARCACASMPSTRSNASWTLHVTVALGMPANERMDLLVEKATELGVATDRSRCCASARCCAWPETGRSASGRIGKASRPPRPSNAVAPACPRWPRCRRSMPSWRNRPRQACACCSARARAWPRCTQVAAGARALLTLSGPEGGLSAAEEDAALAGGFVRARLGDRVLRAETAPLAVLAWAGLKEP